VLGAASLTGSKVADKMMRKAMINDLFAPVVESQKRYDDLLTKVGHDREVAERLIEHERNITPKATRSLLIENAIKHNIINTQSKLDIKIVDQSGFLIVTNNLNKKNKNASSLGLGLENLIKRHEMIINKKPIIVQDQKVFTVKIPYIYE